MEPRSRPNRRVPTSPAAPTSATYLRRRVCAVASVFGLASVTVVLGPAVALALIGSIAGVLTVVLPLSTSAVDAVTADLNRATAEIEFRTAKLKEREAILALERASLELEETRRRLRRL